MIEIQQAHEVKGRTPHGVHLISPFYEEGWGDLLFQLAWNLFFCLHAPKGQEWVAKTIEV